MISTPFVFYAYPRPLEDCRPGVFHAEKDEYKNVVVARNILKMEEIDCAHRTLLLRSATNFRDLIS